MQIKTKLDAPFWLWQRIPRHSMATKNEMKFNIYMPQWSVRCINNEVASKLKCGIAFCVGHTALNENKREERTWWHKAKPTQPRYMHSLFTSIQYKIENISLFRHRTFVFRRTTKYTIIDATINLRLETICASVRFQRKNETNWNFKRIDGFEPKQLHKVFFLCSLWIFLASGRLGLVPHIQPYCKLFSESFLGWWIIHCVHPWRRGNSTNDIRGSGTQLLRVLFRSRCGRGPQWDRTKLWMNGARRVNFWWSRLLGFQPIDLCSMPWCKIPSINCQHICTAAWRSYSVRHLATSSHRRSAVAA